MKGCPAETVEVPADLCEGDYRTKYKRLAVSLHPDKNLGCQKLASDKFHELTSLYARCELSDERDHEKAGSQTSETATTVRNVLHAIRNRYKTFMESPQKLMNGTVNMTFIFDGNVPTEQDVQEDYEMQILAQEEGE
jgi:DnaJ-class molecular chaperone